MVYGNIPVYGNIIPVTAEGRGIKGQREWAERRGRGIGQRE